MNKELENINEELENAIETLEDDTLSSVAGGCVPNCGNGFTTPLNSCTTGVCP
jgi:hypothetical protein